MKKQITVLLIFLLMSGMSHAQGLKGNPANYEEPRVLFISPAAMARQNMAQIATGYELYYSGLFHNVLAALSLPSKRLGVFGWQGQYFTAEVYRQADFSFVYGRTLLHQKIGLGLNLGLFFFSYNQGDFQLVDPGDPVFREGTSKSALDLGLSLLANPIDPLFIGLTIKHLNRPNISLVGDDVRLPIYFQSGLLLRWAIVSPVINFEYDEQELNIDLGLQRWFLNHKFMIRANYYRYNLGVTAGFIIPLANNWVRLDYEYRYPLSELSGASNAYHLFMVSYGFSRRAQDFQLTVRTPKLSVQPGESARSIIDIKRIGGFSDPINLNIIGPDHDIKTSLIPVVSNDNRPIILTLAPSRDCNPGVYRFSLNARGNEKEKDVPIFLEVKARPSLFVDIQASVARLIIKETTKIKSRDPLLPYIFFAENQFSLNEPRYDILNPERQPVKNFIFFPERLLDFSEKYRNTLNIIAKRLWNHREMEIIVRGYVSHWGIEKDNLELSRHRAETVRDYLIKNCGVRPGQVNIEAHLLPPDPASNLDPRGREENQRVEISCPVHSQAILDPIETETSEIAASDPTCTFMIQNFVAEGGLKKWKLTMVEASGDTFTIFQGQKLPPKELVWDWKNEAGQSVMVDKTYHYQLSLQDDAGQIFSTRKKQIPVEKISAIEREYIQKNVEKTRLILFKYDRANMDLTSRSLREELELNVQKLKGQRTATLLVQGYTDIIGDPDYNMRLSMRRAESVATYFIEHGISRSLITDEGFGTTRPLMDNNLPEGRMMNRRVEIYILY